MPGDLVEGFEGQRGPAYLWLDEKELPIRTDIMSGSLDLPQEELRKLYNHLTFHQTTEITQGKEPSDKPTNKPVEQLLRET